MRFQRLSLPSGFPRRLGVLALAGLAAMACTDQATSPIALPQLAAAQ